ncbi:MAG: hypothetical protein ACO1QB_08525 [Verrucomicrobiales bacterium]
MRNLVISVDYEIFGNGSGDVRQHMVNPTERMARICEHYKAPLTIFVEMEECLSFVKYRSSLKLDLGYDPAQLIQDQLRFLSQRGHDLQLHLHPEWLGCKYEGGQWILHKDKQTVDSLFSSQGATDLYIRERKKALESISGKPATSYRAGAFSAQPGAKLLSALASNGFFIDSSVVKGLTRRTPHIDLDYRQAPCAKGPWRVVSDVSCADRSGSLWEFPIFSKMGRRWQQATFGRIKAKFSRNVPKQRQQQMIEQLGISRNPFHLLKFLASPIPIKLDFHNLSPSTLLSMIRSAPRSKNGLPDIMVLIGHSKEHQNDEAFSRFLELVQREPELRIVGFSDVVEMMKSA